MSENTKLLSTDEIRNAFSQTGVWLPGISFHDYGSAFDRWLAEHDREVAEAAWNEGFDSCANWWEIHHHGLKRDDTNPHRLTND